ncbi:prohormone 4 [Echinococcus multilocularis]|uniref:Prohormone 4 n=1 Tax=Echinococcus multilocularis TaxID=6211 RepID=A0A068XY98_ECHMU|nr:prohormone 4 [Echinococcus multilocularis]
MTIDAFAEVISLCDCLSSAISDWLRCVDGTLHWLITRIEFDTSMPSHRAIQRVVVVGMIFYLLSKGICSTISARSNEKDAKKKIANECPESSPWPCREPGFCLSFDFICDGELDCPDGYDEDREMCTAKQRPPIEYLFRFIQRYQDWLIPTFLGEGTPLELAKKLVESPTIEDYARSAHLTEKQLFNLNSLIEGVVQRKEMHMVLLGMPLGAWSELFYLFNRIVSSGFVGTVDSI